MQIGATFSHRHLGWLGLDKFEAIKEFKRLGLTYIRLGCYWSEIEEKEGQFSFEEIEPLVEFCELNKISVALTVGMKAPRHPEYYIPEWLLPKLDLRKNHVMTLDDKLLLYKTSVFIEKVIRHFKTSKAIKVWQVENEPVDSPDQINKWTIRADFLAEEISLAKRLDTREILINLWGNELSKRNYYSKVLRIADIIGFDIYLKRPVMLLNKFIKYIGPLETKGRLAETVQEIRRTDKKIWITELQAEPWEPNEGITSKANPPSFLPENLQSNVEYARALNPEIVFLWGFEYWYLRKIKGDSRYWDAAKHVLKNT